MGILVDIIVLAIALICILNGYRRGLSKSLFKIISFALAIVLTIVLYKPVANIIKEKTNYQEEIKKVIVEKFSNEQKNNSEDVQEDDKETKSLFLSDIKEEIKGKADEEKNKIVEEAAVEISDKVIAIGVAIIVFILIRVILLVLLAILNIFTSLPVLRQVDKIGGIVYGVLQGLIIIYILLAILSFSDVVEILTPIRDEVQSSLIASVLYNNNVLINMFF